MEDRICSKVGSCVWQLWSIERGIRDNGKLLLSKEIKDRK
jgi:hypothetical protein